MPELGYQVHLQNYSWRQGFVYDGMATGTVGLDLQMEAIQITGLPQTVQYRAHVAGLGWLPWVSNGGIAGTTGQARQMEALQFRDTGNSGVQIYGRAHVAADGWLGVIAGTDVIGTTGHGYKMQGIQLMMAKPMPSGTPAGGPTTEPSIGDYKLVKDLAIALFSTARCLGTIGEIAVQCAATQLMMCPEALQNGELTLYSSCTTMVTSLGKLIPGQQYVAPAPPGTSVLGINNPAPPGWVPGGNSVRPGYYFRQGDQPGPGGVIEVPIGDGNGTGVDIDNPRDGDGGGPNDLQDLRDVLESESSISKPEHGPK